MEDADHRALYGDKLPWSWRVHRALCRIETWLAPLGWKRRLKPKS